MKDHHTIAGKLEWDTIRRWKRYHVDLRLRITHWKDGAKAVVFGQGSDISEGGMAAYIPAEFAKDDNLDVEIVLPYSAMKDPVLIKTVVRNRNGFRYGLEYVLVTDHVREALVRSLKALELVQE
jgi:PilZ domain